MEEKKKKENINPFFIGTRQDQSHVHPNHSWLPCNLRVLSCKAISVNDMSHYFMRGSESDFPKSNFTPLLLY